MEKSIFEFELCLLKYFVGIGIIDDNLAMQVGLRLEGTCTFSKS